MSAAHDLRRSERASCRGCGAEIVWIATGSGKACPVDAKPEKRYVKVRYHEQGADIEVWELRDTYLTHFVTCPVGDSFRKK